MFRFITARTVEKALRHLDDPDPEVRCKGAERLEKLGESRLAAASAPERVQAALVGAVADGNKYVPLRALMAINALGLEGPDVLKACIAGLKARHAYARASAAKGLLRLRRPGTRALSALLEAMAEEKDETAYNRMWDALCGLEEAWVPRRDAPAVMTAARKVLDGSLKPKTFGTNLVDVVLSLYSKSRRMSAADVAALSLYAADGDYTRTNSKIIDVLVETGITHVDQIEPLIRATETSANRWLVCSVHCKDEGIGLVEATTGVIAQLGAAAGPALEHLKAAQWSGGVRAAASGKEIIRATLGRLREEHGYQAKDPAGV